MIAQEHWPEMPPVWNAIDGQLTTALEASPICDELCFAPRQLEIVRLACMDKKEVEISRDMYITSNTTHTQLLRVSQKIRNFIEDTAIEREAGAMIIRPTKLTLHGIAYVLLDSGHITAGSELPRAEITPSDAIFLKSLALNYPLKQSDRHARIGAAHYTFASLQEKFSAKTPQGIIATGYRMGFFAPSVEPQALTD